MNRTSGLLVVVALLYGCEGWATPVEANVPDQLMEAASGDLPVDAEQRDLATLRRAATSYHRFETASAAGWSAQITPCITTPNGGMGYHYARRGFIDTSLRVDEPEVLLYEPEATGRMRLVGVEYMVPLTAWKSPEPPRLFGRDFAVNEELEVWALHVWAWETNPRGMYADWNPLVTCRYAAIAALMNHL